MAEEMTQAALDEAAAAVTEALSAMQRAIRDMRERRRALDEMIAQAPQLVRLPDRQWRAASDQDGFPTEGKVWVSDGERVWDIWARGGIPASATACKFWLDGYVWPAPPSDVRVRALEMEE